MWHTNVLHNVWRTHVLFTCVTWISCRQPWRSSTWSRQQTVSERSRSLRICARDRDSITCSTLSTLTHVSYNVWHTHVSTTVRHPRMTCLMSINIPRLCHLQRLWHTLMQPRGLLVQSPQGTLRLHKQCANKPTSLPKSQPLVRTAPAPHPPASGNYMCLCMSFKTT